MTRPMQEKSADEEEGLAGAPRTRTPSFSGRWGKSSREWATRKAPLQLSLIGCHNSSLKKSHQPALPDCASPDSCLLPLPRLAATFFKILLCSHHLRFPCSHFLPLEPAHIRRLSHPIPKNPEVKSQVSCYLIICSISRSRHYCDLETRFFTRRF